MAESNGTHVPNGGVYVDLPPEKDNGKYDEPYRRRDETLYAVLRALISSILFPDPNTTFADAPMLHRVKVVVSEKGPLLRDASRNTGRDLLLWTRRGSPLRALLVVSAGIISGLAATGLFVFMLFFVAATVNAVVIAVLMSLAAAGGFLALFFAALAAIYIGALAVAVFVISTVTLSAIVAVVVATGWVGFFFAIWLATKKSMGLAKHSLNVSASALSAYSVARNDRRQANKHSD